MSVYGLQPTGFVLKPMSTIVTELEAAYQAAFGATVALDSSTVYGQMIGIHSEREALLWQLLQAIYLSIYPDSSSGAALSKAVGLTGHTRNKPTFSSAVLSVVGVNGTVIPAGSQVEVTGTTNVFATITPITITGGVGSAVAVCTVAGPIAAPAGTLTTILTPITGWASVTNSAAGLEGVAVETDAALKLRRLNNIVVSKGGTAAAIENAIKLVAGVTFAGVRMNRTGATVGSLPPHSIEAVVIGGVDQEVANAIWSALPGGIAMYGIYTAQTVIDSFGVAQSVLFTRGSSVSIYLDVTLTRTAGYPGDTVVEDALVAYVNALGNSGGVINWELMGSLFGIPGMSSVVILQGTSFPATSSANTALTADQVPNLNAGSITMH